MAKTIKRNFIRIDDLIWTHDEFRALTPQAGLAFIFMIAWSNAKKLDGIVTPLGAQFTDAGPEQVEELINAGFVEREGPNLRIVKFAEWQVTNAEWGAVSAVAATNGAKGGTARQENYERSSGPTMEAIPGDHRETWLKDAMGGWPAPGSGYRAEDAKTVRPAFMASVQTDEDWEGFKAALNARIARYEAERAPNKRKLLGSLRQFCDKWRYEPIPRPQAPAAPKPKLDDDDGREV